MGELTHDEILEVLVDRKPVGYYSDGRKYEPKDVIRDWGLNFNLGNVVKYISRCGRKYTDVDGVLDDLIKAKNYIQFEIDYITQNEKEGTGNGKTGS